MFMFTAEETVKTIERTVSTPKIRNELERLFSTLDLDGSGVLSSTEFDALSETLVHALGGTSRDAPVSATTIVKNMKKTSFDSVDLNCDQTIDFAEFQTWFHGILAAIKKPEDYKLIALRFAVAEITRGRGQRVRVEIPTDSKLGDLVTWCDGGFITEVTDGGAAAEAGVTAQGSWKSEITHREIVWLLPTRGHLSTT
jgi:hypothetical protein